MMIKKNRIRLAGSLILLSVLAGLWAVESDLTYNVAQQRAILLGRYTLEKTILLLVLTPLLLAGFFQLCKKPSVRPRNGRMAVFKGVSLLLAVLISVVIADLALRMGSNKHYQGDAESYHRVPGKVYRGVFRDRPEFAFSYPNALPGYPEVPYVLTVDRRGFRNPVEHDRYDWIVLGDSFAEGSSVSDEDIWPALLAGKRNVRIYNLGMSGGSPVTYLDTLETFGPELKPRVALYMLYEGNDLRDSNFRARKLEAPKKTSLSDRLFKASPLRRVMKESLQRMLGPVGSKRFAGDPSVHRPGHRMYPVAWLPVEIPAEGGYGYTFDVKRLEQHYLTEDEFRATRAFAESTRLLKETVDRCRELGIELVFIYAPDTPHVVIEDVLERVPPEQLHAFMATRIKALPGPDELVAALREGTRVRERVFETVCRELEIPFLSLTEPLREKTRDGVRTYYVYDQHWTPEGHRVVAEFLNARIPVQ